MREVWESERANAGNDPQLQPRRVTMHFVADPNNDQRRYNPPPQTVNEVAVVFVGDDGQPPMNLDLVIYDRNPINPRRRQQTIPACSSHTDPMLYPLFFPYGEIGWDNHMQQEGNRRTRVRSRNSIREFVCYRLAIRYLGNNDRMLDQISLLHRGGFLF